jgi:hypothetical protein
MSDELRKAIQNQAEDLKKRIGWFEKMIEHQNQVISNCQALAEHYRTDLQAANMTLDGLRAEHRKLFPKNGSKE